MIFVNVFFPKTHISVMSTESEENVLLARIQDDTIVTILSTSDDNVNADAAANTTNELGSDNEMVTGDDENHNRDRPVAPVVSPLLRSGVNSTGDINTEDLTAFEQGMRDLDMTGCDGGPNVDSGKLSETPPVDDKAHKTDMEQLFETCSMIQAKQKSNYPVNPPNSCLMDASTVSI